MGNDYIDQLKAFIKQEYLLDLRTITPAKRGYYGETWKIETVEGSYFVKLDYLARHQKLFENSLPVVDYLCSSGLDFIPKVIKTRTGEFHSIFNNAVLAVFEWLDGENIETNESKTFEYQLLNKLYRLTKPGFKLPVAVFSNDSEMRFYENWHLLNELSPTSDTKIVQSLLEGRRAQLEESAARLLHFATICGNNQNDFYLTHGDAGGNFFVSDGKHYLVDWDEVMYAPLEREAWVMGIHEWAQKLFNDTLQENGIKYRLCQNRLAFYCYHMFFHYLNEFMIDFMTHGNSERIEQYFNDGWIEQYIEFADGI